MRINGRSRHDYPVPASQTIVFTQPASPVPYAPGLTVSLSATGGGSGNPVVLTLDAVSTGKGTVSGNTLTITGAGSFVIDANQAGNSSYSAAAQVQKTVVVTQATPTITWPTPVAIGYGTALSSTQLNATASVPGSFVYTPAAGTTPTVGKQTLSVTFTPTDTTDYAPVTTSVQLTVTRSDADHHLADAGSDRIWDCP